jgi:putative Mg2+ transporter-C (MgtC) family protein
MIFRDHPVFDDALRLGLAFLLVLPLGWERERRFRSAGLRTYPLLSVCVCGMLLFTREAAWGPGERADAFFGMLTGIGFVVSGALTTSREGTSDMNTAASLWVAGAIGAALAYGSPPIAPLLSLMSFLALWGPSLAGRRRT